MWYVGHPSPYAAQIAATCTRPKGLSGIGGDTLGCTEVESELQIGGRKGKVRVRPIDVERTTAVLSRRELVRVPLALAKDNVRLQLHSSFQFDF